MSRGRRRLRRRDGRGPGAFGVDGKALRVRNTIAFRGLDGRELYRVQEREGRLRDTYVVQRGGETVARLQKALVTPLRDRFTVEVPGGTPLHVRGNVLDHEYTTTRGGNPSPPSRNGGSACVTPTASR
jgi:uncharacterized protein YxjI